MLFPSHDPIGVSYVRWKPGTDDPLSEFSKTNDRWMSYTTLAATQESAIGPIINEDSNPEHPETTPENNPSLTFVENYRGIDIYQNSVGAYETNVPIIIDGEVDVEVGDSFTNIEDLREVIDESLQ